MQELADADYGNEEECQCAECGRQMCKDADRSMRLYGVACDERNPTRCAACANKPSPNYSWMFDEDRPWTTQDLKLLKGIINLIGQGEAEPFTPEIGEKILVKLRWLMKHGNNRQPLYAARIIMLTNAGDAVLPCVPPSTPDKWVVNKGYFSEQTTRRLWQETQENPNNCYQISPKTISKTH